ncbi:hypothetical protein HYH03_002555 [Edaphochlamys debaryana]|uniref:Uncharacterized protein n=1 Tax=Edaphochlamys debaryana TaxID=47281 RepID=A0A836C3Y9_9CHLO|nr:hypothetical protein HYH03_002555 [Edaphochlamys debaryana]|eukprot:KAG2499616.1 hypothetical protein HYH03_002555 [Edaphochlamys debaryana]
MSGCAGSDPADAQGVRPRKVQLQPEAPSPGYILSHEPQALADQCRLSLDKWVSFAYVLALVRMTLAHVLPSRAYTPVGRLITHTCRLTGAVYAVAMGCPPPSWHARWYFGSFAPFLDLVQFFTDPDPVGWLEAVNGAVHLLCLGVMSHVYYQRGDQLGVGRFSMVARQALVTAVCLGMAPWGRRRRRGGVALTAPLRVRP